MNVFVRYNFLTTKFKVVVFFFFNSAPFGVGVEGGGDGQGVGVEGGWGGQLGRCLSIRRGLSAWFATGSDTREHPCRRALW